MLNAFMEAAKNWAPKLLTGVAPALLPWPPAVMPLSLGNFKHLLFRNQGACYSELGNRCCCLLEKIFTEYPGFTFKQIHIESSEVNFQWQSHHAAVLLQASLN
jgi:hypothetical protein